MKTKMKTKTSKWKKTKTTMKTKMKKNFSLASVCSSKLLLTVIYPIKGPSWYGIRNRKLLALCIHDYRHLKTSELKPLRRTLQGCECDHRVPGENSTCQWRKLQPLEHVMPLSSVTLSLFNLRRIALPVIAVLVNLRSTNTCSHTVWAAGSKQRGRPGKPLRIDFDVSELGRPDARVRIANYSPATWALVETGLI